MKKIVGSMSFVLLLLAVALASAANGTQEDMARYRSGEETIAGYLVIPPGKGPFPAVVVIHEWWGLNEQTKEEARKLAAQGYVALAIDLYRGRSASDSGEAHELMRGLPVDRARRDLLAAFDYLAARSDVRGDRIGSIGWCMGGGYSLALALAQPRLAASVIYYGRLVTDESALREIQAPILALFGDQDRGIPVSSVRTFEAALRNLGKTINVHIYSGAGHAFANPNRASYRESAARDAWTKTLAFFAQHLERE